MITYKAHIWYEGTSHQYTSAVTKVKVICKYKGYISQKMAISGAFMFHKHILFHNVFLKLFFSSMC